MRPKMIIYRQYPTIRMQICSLIYYLDQVLKLLKIHIHRMHPITTMGSYLTKLLLILGSIAQVELESYDGCWFRSWHANYQSFYDIPDAAFLTNSSCRWRFNLVSFELLTHNDSFTFR